MKKSVRWVSVAALAARIGIAGIAMSTGFASPSAPCTAANAGQQVTTQNGNRLSIWECWPNDWVLVVEYWCDAGGTCTPI